MRRVKVIEVDTQSTSNFEDSIITANPISESFKTGKVNFNDQDISNTILREIAEKRPVNENEEIVYFQINAKISFIVKPKE
ncbi:MAG: dodecin domain-containing protein [Cyclobacteriaceae bacterium]